MVGRMRWLNGFCVAQRAQFAAEQSHLLRQRAHLLLQRLHPAFLRRRPLLLRVLRDGGLVLRVTRCNEKSKRKQNGKTFHCATPSQELEIFEAMKRLKPGAG